MSDLTYEQIKKVYKLARIRPENEQEITETFNKIKSILDFVDILSEIDTDNVDLDQRNDKVECILRPDVITDGNIRDQILSNTEDQYGCFVVPKVVDEA